MNIIMEEIIKVKCKECGKVIRVEKESDLPPCPDCNGETKKFFISKAIKKEK